MVKTALKLLLVFVEYTESNTTLLIKAVDAVDGKRGEASAPVCGRFQSADRLEGCRLYCGDTGGGESVALFRLHSVLK